PWRTAFGGVADTVSGASSEAMPSMVAGHHVGLSMRRLELRASSAGATPTKLAEFLASGRPVVVSAGLGDMDVLLAGRGCGVVVDDVSDTGLDRAADELEHL